MSKVVLPQMIDYYRKQNNMTMSQMGEKLGKTTSAISRWISGSRSPMVEDLERLAVLFNVDVKTLMYGANDEYIDKITQTVSKLSIKNQKNVYDFAKDQLKDQNKKVVSLPTQDDAVQLQANGVLSAGVGEFLDDSTETFPVTVHEPIPKCYDYVFKVNGRSMEPTFEDGQVIFVTKREEYRSGQIVAAIVDDCAYVKRLRCTPDEMALVSLNPDYPNVQVLEDDNYRILGVAFA